MKLALISILILFYNISSYAQKLTFPELASFANLPPTTTEDQLAFKGYSYLSSDTVEIDRQVQYNFSWRDMKTAESRMVQKGTWLSDTVVNYYLRYITPDLLEFQYFRKYLLTHSFERLGKDVSSKSGYRNNEFEVILDTLNLGTSEYYSITVRAYPQCMFIDIAKRAIIESIKY